MSNSSKYYGENGIHRVPLWRIAGFALNNTATNFYMFLMNYVAYYLTGIVGVAVVTASSFAMMMRIWDGVTDPFVGFVVDKTNGRFGKNRPFMLAGNIVLMITSGIMFHVTGKLPENTGVRFAFFTVVAAVYYIGYTLQCVSTKSAQTCLTNDPKQRPLFAVFDGIYNTILFTILAIVAAKIGTKYGTMAHEGVFHEMWLMTAICSFVFTCIAIFSIAPKDRQEFFGTGEPQKVTLKDYWDTLKNNRAIQMLIVAASSDKLANTAKTSTVTLVLFAVLVGNYSMQGKMTGMTTIPGLLLLIFCVGGLATRLGQKRAMVIGSIGGIVIYSLLILLWLFGDPTTMCDAEGGVVFSFFTIAYIVLSVAYTGFTGLTSSIVIPMTADCADYEVYRSGRYVPGLMGTLFSLVDKLISSFAPMLAGLLYASIGFKDALPDINTAYSVELRNVTLFLAYGMVIIGLICNLIAMKFYPLSKEYMAEIQDKINEIKQKSLAKAKA